VIQPRFLAAVSALTIAGSMGLAAQAPVQPPVTRPQPPAPAQPAGRLDQPAITVTGCLKPWDHAMSAPADTPAAGQQATAMTSARFVLTDLEPMPAPGQPAAAPGTPAPTPSAAPAPPAHPRATQFVVVAGTGVNLAAHVNHKVRITGTAEGLTPAPSAMNAPATRPVDPPPAAGRPAPPAAHEAAWSTLTAASLTMVSATCTTAS
jgi:hypothetical protein